MVREIYLSNWKYEETKNEKLGRENSQEECIFFRDES